jgi:hypothetical protein
MAHSVRDSRGITSHRLRDVQLDGWAQHARDWSYDDLAGDPTWRHGWISFDALAWDPTTKRVLCGMNSMDGDILHAFDPEAERFTSLGATAWADEYDSKIHRTLLRDPRDGSFVFATSLLHDGNHQHDAPGGKVVRYLPGDKRYEVLGIPFPHLYVQSIAADWGRDVVYGFTYPAEFVVRMSMQSGESRTLGYVGNAIMMAQPHNGVVDKYGRLWGTYAETRAWDDDPGRNPVRLFYYDPDADRFHWLDYGLSRKSDTEQLLPDPEKPFQTASVLTETRHAEDYGFCDSMCYDGDRYIYAGTVAGVLCRIDVETDAVEKIAHVMAAGRFPAMMIDDRRVLYGAGGMKYETQLVRWEIGTERIEDIGVLEDAETHLRPARIHDVCRDDRGNVYLAENDNHDRSSYLWKVTGV